MGLTLSIAVLSFWPGDAEACSLAQAPYNEQRLSETGGTIPLLLNDGGMDTQPPGRPTLSDLQVRLVLNPCRGDGASCPDLDVLTLSVSASDERTPADRLRYLGYFGGSASEVDAAQPEILFSPDWGRSSTLSAHLGLNRERSGRGFSRENLCFALATVDEAANVSERSDVLCVDTTDERSSSAVVRQSSPCGGPGCGGLRLFGAMPLAMVALVLLRSRRGT